MATKKPPAIPSTIERLEPLNLGDDAYRAHYRETHYRFLFDGGYVCDVYAVSDGSDLRRAVLEATNLSGIVGVAIIEDQ